MLFVVYEICANAISAQNVFMVTKCDIAQCSTGNNSNDNGTGDSNEMVWLSDGNSSPGLKQFEFRSVYACNHFSYVAIIFNVCIGKVLNASHYLHQRMKLNPRISLCFGCCCSCFDWKQSFSLRFKYNWKCFVSIFQSCFVFICCPSNWASIDSGYSRISLGEKEVYIRAKHWKPQLNTIQLREIQNENHLKSVDEEERKNTHSYILQSFLLRWLNDPIHNEMDTKYKTILILNSL